MSTLSSFPSTQTLVQSRNPLDQWDADELIRSYLSNCPPPRDGHDPVIMRSRLKMFRVRIAELQKLRATIYPVVSPEIDRELAVTFFRRKILLWMAFPIRDLPAEILTQIFRYVVWSSNGADQATQHRLRLTWVCKRFREVALADSTLWNSVWFRDAPPWDRSLAFIERSGTAPIDIRINEKERPEGAPENAPAPYPPITVPQINLILDKIIPRIRQLRIVVIVLEDLQVVETFMRRFSAAGPPENLERFEMHRIGQPYLWPKEYADEGEEGPIPFTTHPTPKLRWISLNGVGVDWSRFPPTNLRTIDLRRMCVQACPTAAQWERMLESSKDDLFKLTLDSACAQLTAQRSRTRPPIELPCLRDLTIGDMSCIYALQVLAQMHAPKVMSLALTSLFGQDYSPLVEDMTGRFPEVRVLQVQGLEMPKTDLNLRRTVRWFESMPRLKLFKFSQTRPHVLEALLADPREHRLFDKMDVQTARAGAGTGADGQEDARPVICPELQAIFFQTQGERDVSTLAKGRKDLGVPLKRVYTSEANQANVGPDEAARIREHVGHLCVMNHTMLTEEEDIIHEEMANSLGLAVRWRRYKR
ncbi:hypothetical protein C8Q77DRAFT_1082044 [Trametes polyzona]|nr:hypothetical protein C8Q77DRAFT_1082044 [Trametes polyzona]